MKTFLLTPIMLLAFITAKAQSFTENFNTGTIASLEASCWVMNGAIMNNQAGEAINAVSLSTLPPTNPNAKTDVYTPILIFSSNSTTIDFDYRLSSTLNGSGYRNIDIVIVTLTGDIILSNTIYLPPGTNSTLQHYSHVFSPLTPGSYRVAFRVSGGQGNGNVRFIMDNLVISDATKYITPTCSFTAIVDRTLPVKLNYFTAQLNTNSVSLKWATSTEVNFSHFVIERSYNGINFEEIATIFGFGNSTDIKNYQYSDKAFASAKTVIYYRLRQVDIDAKSEYSATRMIRIGNNDNPSLSILTYPNPVSKELRITIPENWQNKVVVYELINMSGQVTGRIINATSGQTEVMNVSNLQSGIYILKATCEGKSAQQKIIKQ